MTNIRTRLKRLNRKPTDINMYDLSSAGRRAMKSKVYPFSSTRQNERTAQSQIMVENTNGHMVMNTRPVWGRAGMSVLGLKSGRVSANG